MRPKGFTMIELLVVISIIALLAAFVSTQLVTARAKGADGAVKTTFKQLFSQAEMYRNDYGGFGSGAGATTDVTDCVSGFFNDPQITSIKTSILRNAAPGATFACSTASNGQIWAMSVSALKGGGPWCIDNSGNYKSATAASGVCP